MPASLAIFPTSCRARRTLVPVIFAGSSLDDSSASLPVKYQYASQVGQIYAITCGSALRAKRCREIKFHLTGILWHLGVHDCAGEQRACQKPASPTPFKERLLGRSLDRERRLKVNVCGASPVSENSAFRAGIVKKSRSADPMRIWEWRKEQVPALPFIVPMSPPGYSSAWLRPRRARYRVAQQAHCSSTTSSRLNLRLVRHSPGIGREAASSFRFRSNRI